MHGRCDRSPVALALIPAGENSFLLQPVERKCRGPVSETVKQVAIHAA
jgi:hypothetical protein